MLGGRLALVLGVLALAACHSGPTADQAIAQCELSGATADPDAHGVPGGVGFDYMTTCMRAHGFRMIANPSRCPFPTDPNPLPALRGEAHWASCYEPS